MRVRFGSLLVCAAIASSSIGVLAQTKPAPDLAARVQVLEDRDAGIVDLIKIFRDKHPSALPAVEERRPRMDALLDTLAKAGIQRKDLNLAWDFTVASKANLTGRMLAIRDAGLAATPDGVPPLGR